MIGIGFASYSLLFAFTFVAAVTNVEQAFTENEISPRLIPVAPTKIVNVKAHLQKYALLKLKIQRKIRIVLQHKFFERIGTVSRWSCGESRQ